MRKKWGVVLRRRHQAGANLASAFPLIFTGKKSKKLRKEVQKIDDKIQKKLGGNPKNLSKKSKKVQEKIQKK